MSSFVVPYPKVGLQIEKFHNYKDEVDEIKQHSILDGFLIPENWYPI